LAGVDHKDVLVLSSVADRPQINLVKNATNYASQLAMQKRYKKAHVRTESYFFDENAYFDILVTFKGSLYV